MICDLTKPVSDPCKIESPPLQVQCRPVRHDIDDLSHSPCEPVGVTVQNFDIVNAGLCSGLSLGCREFQLLGPLCSR